MIQNANRREWLFMQVNVGDRLLKSDSPQEREHAVQQAAIVTANDQQPAHSGRFHPLDDEAIGMQLLYACIFGRTLHRGRNRLDVPKTMAPAAGNLDSMCHDLPNIPFKPRISSSRADVAMGDESSETTSAGSKSYCFRVAESVIGAYRSQAS